MNKKQRKEKEFKERKQREDEKKEQTEQIPEVATEEPKRTSKFVAEDKSTKVVNLTGEAALLGAGKRQKKKLADEAKKREEEAQALKERILKAK